MGTKPREHQSGELNSDVVFVSGSVAPRGVVKSPNWAKKGGLRLYRTRGQKQCPRAGCLHLTVKRNSGASKGRVVEGDGLP
jgi:hypothetical protein